MKQDLCVHCFEPIVFCLWSEVPGRTEKELAEASKYDQHFNHDKAYGKLWWHPHNGRAACTPTMVFAEPLYPGERK